MTKFNFYLGAAASAWLLTVLVIAAELIEPLKNALKAAFTHHWIGKGVIITLAFIIFGYLLREKNSLWSMPDNKLAWYSVLSSLSIIFLFFVAEYFKIV